MKHKTDIQARNHVEAWLEGEAEYVEAKWGHRARLDDATPHANEADFHRDITMYLHRSSVLGLDTPLGRQALAKGLAAYIEFVVLTVRTHGDLPPAGVPSGQR